MSTLIIIICFIVLSVIFHLAYKTAKRQSTSSLKNREVLEFEEWIVRYYPENILSKVVIWEVLSTIAEELNINPTQIRTQDRFLVEFAFRSPYNWILPDPPIDVALQEIYERYDLKMSGQKINTVRDLLDNLCQKING